MANLDYHILNISCTDVIDFKERYCDENSIITSLLKNNLCHKFIEPILDVGAGTGDITATALANMRVIHIDVLDYCPIMYPLPDYHDRLKIDFYDYIPDKININTILLCHVLQYLDDDLLSLNNKIDLLNPVKIVTVSNKNNDFMGKIISFMLDHFEKINAEVEIPSFPLGYSEEQCVDFTASLECPDFATLAKQVSFLMDCMPSDRESMRLQEFLRDSLSRPAFTINQSIRIYRRYDKQSFKAL